MSVDLIKADARHLTRHIEPGSVDCIVTSPPYYQLRDYGYAEQIGLEGSIAEYLAQMTLVMAECLRVLKPTGTMWVNMGDSYSSGGRGGGGSFVKERRAWTDAVSKRGWRSTPGIRAKCKLMMPSRLALMMIDLGFLLRQEIIWHKPSCMPESCKDRPTTAHETLYLFSRARKYFYDQAAVREPAAPSSLVRLAQDTAAQAGSHRANGAQRDKPMKAVAGWDSGPGNHDTIEHNKGERSARDNFKRQRSKRGEPVVPGAHCGTHRQERAESAYDLATRNLRSVWSIPSEPSKDAHYASFPTALAELCIKAGCPPGGLVLDPFCGTGRTLVAAKRLGRRAIGVDLSDEYLAIARGKVWQDVTPNEEERELGQQLIFEA